MIKITNLNRDDEIILTNKELKKVQDNYNLYVHKEDTDWDIEIIFEKKNDKIIRIAKQLSSADGYSGDLMSEYRNQIKSSNEVVLLQNDYDEVKRLLLKLRDGDKYFKRTIINAYAQLLAYEYYNDTVVYELNDITIMGIYKDMYSDGYYSEERKKYIKDIIEKAKEILKKEYNVNLIDGGKKDE